MSDIHVSYNETIALCGIDFDLYSGEIHALVGSHRSGKSTLVKLLSGAVRKDSGTIIYKGNIFEYFTPQTSIQNKIGIVYQHLNIIPSLNTIENIFAGQMPGTRHLSIDYNTMLAKTYELFNKLNLQIDINKPLIELTKAEQHMVEIARIILLNPDIIILDEVSSKLAPHEMEKMYPIILDFKKQGKTIIYVSRNIDEIFDFADRVTILNAGRRMGTESVKDIDKIKLINLTFSFVIDRENLIKESSKLFYFKKYNENIIKNIPIGVIILDTEDKTYLVNFSAVKILNLENSEFDNQSINALLDGKIIEKKDKILETIKFREKLIMEEVIFNNEKILKISIFPFKDDNFVLLGTIILMEDISKDKYFKDYLLRIEKISSIAELAAGVAHEINNPLGIVKNYIELLKIEEISTTGRLKLVKIENEIDRINRIVESLLSFSKLNTFAKTKINIINVIEEIILLLGHKLKIKCIKLKKNYSSNEIYVSGDENKLKQVFINLLVNSTEAVLNEGKIAVEISSNHKKSFTNISIIDNGCGIPEEIINKIFDPFFSTKANKKNAGLGLSICHHIIELHEGIITCTSKPGANTCFNIRLPLLDGNQQRI